ncbi:hypothetical protein K474DRAFT_1613843 [Panus rudis PR-1116 ss-1]|nr:hypothetical protein K474DRAFT_1613843 [Panus rudis PR-1116 ss-1]
MTLTIGPPLLLALSIRILVNFLNPEHTSSISDYLLYGLWQGVLLYHTLIHLAECVFIVAIGILAVLAYNALGPNGFDATKCACMILGIALGVLVTNVLSMVLEDGGTAVSDTRISSAALATSIPLPETTTRRTRKVSFGRATTDREREKERERERERDRERHRHTSHRHTTTTREREPEPHVISPVPTLAYSVDTAPSISIDSVSSSIDPKGTMSPAEREVAILRARASLADSERRRFKEERKWALSMGNKPRANQLAWQVKRYTALMESYHREADAKVVEGLSIHFWVKE